MCECVIRAIPQLCSQVKEGVERKNNLQYSCSASSEMMPFCTHKFRRLNLCQVRSKEHLTAFKLTRRGNDEPKNSYTADRWTDYRLCIHSLSSYFLLLYSNSFGAADCRTFVSTELIIFSHFWSFHSFIDSERSRQLFAQLSPFRIIDFKIA